MPLSLSKSTFVRGTQCKKSLWLHWHSPELRDPLSAMQQAIFSQGTDVGRLAQQLFPGGTNAGIFVPENYPKSIELTAQLIKDGATVIYEAGFSVNSLHCFMDILVKDGDGWKAFEVKSSTTVKPVNLLDTAFQYHVMTLSGLKVNDISLVVLDTEYERTGELSVSSLFKTESVLKQVLKLLPRMKKDIAEFFTVLSGSESPDIDIGPHCSDPYDCDFRGHCWQYIPEYSVFDIARLSGIKKWELYRMGILRFEDIPEGFSLNDTQWQQVRAELKNERIVNKAAIRQFISGLHYPLYLLDFESFQPAVPLFDHSRPYQQIVFQYSLHIEERPGAALIHRSFLADADGTDPRIPFITSLVKDLGDQGDIVVFNRAFEATRLQEMAACFPEFSGAISRIIDRIKDLMLIFQQRHYYDPAMKGSYSIKQVLPSLVPSFSYEDLAIADGGSASWAFASLMGEEDLFRIMEVRSNLLEYCKMDTLAMVEILRVLEENCD